ncbi:hypothetical protein G3O08_01605 [Cryomorpha ignava]|uniref:Uncharacterized protein n=1 Tax=Cryomorpha ignava TaxID=101383 RepID=A0A7K3WKY9_9FLAO|nr:hypothetical protein [Cryomorpha ignava]NEN22198.1 hypothetical protein [Cryomorpha ignava]
MFLCFVEGHKDGVVIKNIEVDWWNASKLESKYHFNEVVFAGELDYHLTVSAVELKEILEDNIHVYKYDKLTDGIRILMTKRARITDQIEDLIAHSEEYDELKIILFYWQSSGGAF